MAEVRNEITGWCPFATQVPSQFYWMGRHGPTRAVVLHIGECTYQDIFRILEKRKLSAHFVVGKQGEVAQLVSIYDTAWGNGLRWENGIWYTPSHDEVVPRWPDIVPDNPNWYTISIEHEGFPNEPWTVAMDAANTQLLQWIASRLNLVYEGGHTLIGHCDINPRDKPNCPGPNVDYTRIAADANGQVPQLPAISVDLPLLGPASGLMRQAVAYVQAHLVPGSEYTNDVGTIMGYYWKYGPSVGMDPFMAAAQCVHETDSLNSHWASRPHRNPAGLGVKQEGGLSFESWDLAVQAHFGQLLAMALTDAEATEAQRAMMARNPRHHLIPAEWRGVAHCWRDLGGHWTQNPAYADGVARRALQMRAL